jgi:hypothetical protein
MEIICGEIDSATLGESLEIESNKSLAKSQTMKTIPIKKRAF